MKCDIKSSIESIVMMVHLNKSEESLDWAFDIALNLTEDKAMLLYRLLLNDLEVRNLLSGSGSSIFHKFYEKYRDFIRNPQRIDNLMKSYGCDLIN